MPLLSSVVFRILRLKQKMNPSPHPLPPPPTTTMRMDHVLNMPRMPSQHANHSSSELVEEIAMLEAEIANLEQHILSLYRTAFQQHFPTSPGSRPVQQMEGMFPWVGIGSDHPPQETKSEVSEDFTDSCPIRALAGTKDLARLAIPKSSSGKEKKKKKKSACSLLEGHFENNGTDDTLVLADSLSVDIIRCISSIYCKFVNPKHNENSVSSNSSFRSSSTFSPRGLSGRWCPRFSDGVADIYDSEDLKQDVGPYSALVEVREICLNGDSYNYAASMLQKLRSLVKRLATVDPTKMRHEQKLAFWINIHNALLMHSYLAYGTQSYIRCTSILKATYNVGGHRVSAYDIQSYILGIKTHYHALWLQSLLSPGKRIKNETKKHVYAIENPEPLVHFSLCSGAYSDPSVRIYYAKSVFRDLKVAREEFIRERVRVEVDKQTKVHLPKILKYYAKDTSLGMSALLEVVSECLSGSHQETIRTLVKARPEKCVHWLEQSPSFRYLFHKEVSS